MDQKLSDIETEIVELKRALLEQSTIINKIILMIYLADTDLKNHTEILDQ